MAYLSTFNTVILLLPLVLTVIAYIVSYIIGNNCVFENENGAYSGNCSGINNTLTWMKMFIYIYIPLFIICIMISPYALGEMFLISLFSKKSNNTKPSNINNNQKNSKLNNNSKTS